METRVLYHRPQTVGDFRKHCMVVTPRVWAVWGNLVCPIPHVTWMKDETLAYGYVPPYLTQNFVKFGGFIFFNP